MRNAIHRFSLKIAGIFIAATVTVAAAASLTVIATPASASTALSHPVPFSQIQFGDQGGKTTNVTFTRFVDKYTKFELSGKTAPVLKATFELSKSSVTYSFTGATITEIKVSGTVVPVEMVTWQFTTMSVSQNGHMPSRGDFLQSTPHLPYP